MKKYIFDECALNDTRTTSLEAIIQNRAAGYIKSPNDFTLNHLQPACLFDLMETFLSNINDLLKWEIDMQNNKLLTQKIWNHMWDDQIKTPLTMDNEPIYYAYGTGW